VTSGAERPRLLADAAISVIAGSGMRALTHRAVDAAAGLPSGTTSYHYRTRRELLRAVLNRVAADNAEQLAEIPGPPTDLTEAPVPSSAADRITEARSLALRCAIFVDGRLSAGRSTTLARMACEIEVASDPELRDILHAGDRFRPLAVAAVTRLGSTTPGPDGHGLVSLLDGIQFDRLVGTGSLTAPAPGTDASRTDIAGVVLTYLRGLIPPS
jgi:AcrR family transcriptional regulator